jgi:RNA polymerase sigma-70 factor (ECF subfamily)
VTPVVRKRASRRASANRVAALFDQHASMVLGLCRLLLRDHHEAEDAAQQVFVSAYRSLLRGVEPRDPGPWLAAIARNECRARIRKRIRTPIALDGELEEQLSDPSDLAELADRRVEFAAVTAAIAELPSRQREAVALRDFLGLSYEEVASTLSVSVPVVESLLFRARRRLRDTVRTAPRYAAGLIAVPFAFRAAVAREIPDFEGGGAGLGIAGATAAAAAGVVAKVVSLPFATKAVTAVTVVVAATVGPQLGGMIEDAPSQKDSGAPGVAAPSAEPRGGSAPHAPAAGGDAEAAETHPATPAPIEAPALDAGALAVAEPSATTPAPPPGKPQQKHSDGGGRTLVGAANGAPGTPSAPAIPVPDPAPAPEPEPDPQPNVGQAGQAEPPAADPGTADPSTSGTPADGYLPPAETAETETVAPPDAG